MGNSQNVQIILNPLILGVIVANPHGAAAMVAVVH